MHLTQNAPQPGLGAPPRACVPPVLDAAAAKQPRTTLPRYLDYYEKKDGAGTAPPARGPPQRAPPVRAPPSRAPPAPPQRHM